MEAYKKGTAESYTLVVSPSAQEKHGYFLRDCMVPGFPRLLDFSWTKKGKTKASITFAISDHSEAISLPQSPFGGFWIEKGLSSEVFGAFLEALKIELIQLKISQIRIIQAPKPYEPMADFITYLLFKSGFVQEKILCHQFFMGKKKIKKFAQSEQSKFNQKRQEDGLKVQHGAIQNFGFLNEIRSWNSSRGFSVTFDENRLISQVSEFPDRYFLVTILKGGTPIAHSLCVRLLPDSLFYFLSAINPSASLKNIGDQLLFGIFQLAAEQKVEFIDLGSSETEAGPNHSLMFFKSRFSNEVCNKTSWALKL